MDCDKKKTKLFKFLFKYSKKLLPLNRGICAELIIILEWICFIKQNNYEICLENYILKTGNIFKLLYHNSFNKNNTISFEGSVNSKKIFKNIYNYNCSEKNNKYRRNIWDNYRFGKQYKNYEILNSYIPITSSHMFTCNLKYYYEPSFNTLINTYHKYFNEYLCFTQEFNFELLNYINDLKLVPNKYIGVHIRTCNNGIYNIKEHKFIKKIMDEITPLLNNKYDIFVCTQYEPILKEFINKYGERIKYIKNIIRSRFDWVNNIKPKLTKENIYNYQNECKMAFIDCYILSQSKLIIGGTSKYLVSSLIIGNNTNFHILETLSKRKR